MNAMFARFLSSLLPGLLVLTGCASSEADAPTGAVAAEECERLAAVTPDQAAGTTVLVPDNTASHRATGFSAVVTAALVEAQGRGDRLLVMPVDGAGAPPRVARTIALEPAPGDDSPAAAQARKGVVTCVATWARDDLARPTAGGSAVLDIINAAALERPAKVIVLSDGIANVGQFDLDVLGFGAPGDRVAQRLADADAFAPQLSGISLLWNGLGATVPPLPQPVRADLERIWTAVLTKAGATATFDSTSGAALDPLPDLPADPVTVPEVESVALPCDGTEIIIPGVLLFAGESTVLEPGADEVLGEIARQLRARAGARARVDGHAAAYGDDSGRVVKSRLRAEAVKTKLVEFGVAGSRLTTEGWGSTAPLVDEFPGRTHDEAAAARNRRVTVVITEAGCDR
ncbi:OmpA family protein [Actinosynnema sp. NPDC047251]|uniref:OmpA-like domain-containing protein n=1 Tax=Saccharothrix espanaensis (strain ATCC 51144 / DSM 44229 / JCM 9112 / NBRC 15066 / NRRL 15764) TaxID=1179773 RepID=K0JXA1_SACES|nr:OmpA family protein [Saccharothrix espanaensis]CCH29389.1 hypothetical protein BN6_20680 [Saccharothrix espanaensis DSM 44229]